MEKKRPVTRDQRPVKAAFFFPVGARHAVPALVSLSNFNSRLGVAQLLRRKRTGLKTGHYKGGDFRSGRPLGRCFFVSPECNDA
jgi:hypothetical protein